MNAGRMSIDAADRYRGCLLGLAAGDALGMPVEGYARGSFPPVTGMMDGELPAGYFTDDTAMALCLAESLIARKGFDPIDQMERYLRWLDRGHMSSTGRCFGIGHTTYMALNMFRLTYEPQGGPDDPFTAGNGSLMRLAPVPLAYAASPARAIEYAAASSRTTHGAPAAVDACRYFAGLIVGALGGADKDTLLAPRYSPVKDCFLADPLMPDIDEVAWGSYLRREPPDIKGTGYVVRSLEAALWAFSRSEDFREGALMAVNLGDDTDTTAAVYGQLAGAFYGAGAIPPEWLGALAMREKITELADGLMALSVELVQ